MATYGQISTNTTYDSYFWVRWNLLNQDVATNKTKIEWSRGVYCGHSFYSNAIKMSPLSINGTQVHAGGTYSNYSKGEHTTAYGTIWIEHDPDGTKTFSISAFTGWLYSNYDYAAAASDHTLTPIPRGASLTGAVDFNDTDDPTITYSNPLGNSATALEACISLTGAEDDVQYRAIPKTDTSYTFALTEEERDLLCNNTPGTSRKVHFYVRTKIGSNTFWSSQEKTFTVTENSATKPTVHMDVSLNNGSLPGAFDGLYIQGKSRAKVTLSADGKYGAGIQSLYATMEGKTYHPASGKIETDVIKGAGTVEIVGYARDSRGFSGESRQSITVIEYSKPLVVPISSENAILCYRSDGNGKRVGASTSVWIKAGRSFHSVSGKNTCVLEWRSKLATEQWNDAIHLWDDLIPKSSTEEEYNALVPGEFDLKSAYTIQIRSMDDIGEQDIKTLDIPTQDVALHLGRGGKNVTVGTYCDYTEDYTFRSAWKAIFDEDVVIREMPVADFIVEEGVEGIWSYEKWSSGKAVCWGVLEADKERSKGPTTFGDASVVYSTRQTDFPNIFIHTPIVFASPNDAGLGGASAENDGSTDKVCSVTIFGTSTAIGSVSVYALGRWK